jgi:hypothetical protein
MPRNQIKEHPKQSAFRYNYGPRYRELIQAASGRDVFTGGECEGSVENIHDTSEEYLKATITSPTKTTYVADHVAFVREQLTKAAVRLADLLNAIDWK